ncbi:ankyrin, partial [Hypoxylon sp. EC38]
IHLAILQENIKVLRLMVQHDVNLEKRDKHGRTALHVAAFMGNGDICALLIQHNADVNALSGNGMTPLHRCQSSHGGIKAAEVILERLPELINRPDDSGCTALYMACEKGNDRMVEFLLSAKADPNIKGLNGRTPLIAAVMVNPVSTETSHKEHIIKLLLQHGADPIVPDAEGVTALTAAVDLRMDDIEKLL